MSLRFYDTRTQQLRDFEPLEPGKAGLYYCGATTQGMPHVGHVRSAVAFDLVRRWLTHRGLEVTVVRNVTDIDDKILEKSRLSYEDPASLGPDYHADEPWFALSYRFEQAFHAAYAALGVLAPTYEPRATGHITEMHELIQRLIDAGHAYPALDDSGDVYFDVRSYDAYGDLTNQHVDDMMDAADADPRGKRDMRDFALWKGQKASEPETASWPSPWGRGRPGWHLECSAMAHKYLGAAFDIHGGGLDLRFPHHENELAQSTAAGDAFATFWMHNGLVTYEGEKMSKSIGNTISPEEMLAVAPARVVRYFLGQAHYRSQLDYSPSSLAEAGAAVERIDRFRERAWALVLPEDGDFGFVGGTVPEAFGAAMDDDLNVPAALAVLHETVRSGNAAVDAGDAEAAAQAVTAVEAMLEVLGLGELPAGGAEADAATQTALDVLIQARLEARSAARAAKDWGASDAIRDELAAAGIEVADGAQGASWSLKRD
ncbi:cysteine--tRNA ligase [Galactobacter valiniphilus]|uniref:Cysteine--tRNA ligase n=1 Tax=Galactobacter valiniphilus TaxID=2676122 RepID=A0A399J9T8_9MICC|nr:cysteine--tRNA ligase [Galactobacter valiniphilus]RII41840.1 cysteine--tRNA ligase [Galactobacter valiniphilus]